RPRPHHRGDGTAASCPESTCPGRVFRYPRYPQAQDSVVRPWRSLPKWRGSLHCPQRGAPPSVTIPARPRFSRDRFNSLAITPPRGSRNERGPLLGLELVERRPDGGRAVPLGAAVHILDEIGRAHV